MKKQQKNQNSNAQVTIYSEAGSKELSTEHDNIALRKIGIAANAYHAQNVFNEYRAEQTANTLIRHEGGFKLFTAWLATVNIKLTAYEMMRNVHSWHGVTHGLILSFRSHLLNTGYAISTVNAHVSTLRTYANLAHKAGVITEQEIAMINTIKAYGHKKGRNIDEKREVTRFGRKKAEPTQVTKSQVLALKSQPDTPVGRRDALIMALFFDLGLRCSEIVGLTVQSFNFDEETVTFYRKKVDLTQTLRITPDIRRAALKYLKYDHPTGKGALIVGSHNGILTDRGMGATGLTRRVQDLGAALGIDHLSGHDARHYWTGAALKGGSDVKTVQDAGGWASPAMVLRYAQSTKIANEGIKLG